jgi:uncharacterized protein (TIGR03437 family)
VADASGRSGGLPLPDQLNGSQVLLGNQPMPILYTSPGQLNVQVPYGVPVNTQYQLTVQHGNTYSVPQQLVVASAEPGIFTVNQQGSGQGSITHADGSLAQPGAPASIGETVVIYCTGLGPVTPPVVEGAPPPSSPLSTAVNPVTVTIGGLPATVSFAGLTPGDPGLYQINAVGRKRSIARFYRRLSIRASARNEGGDLLSRAWRRLFNLGQLHRCVDNADLSNRKADRGLKRRPVKLRNSSGKPAFVQCNKSESWD